VTIEQLRKPCEAEPFRPFIIHLADGRPLTVRRSEFMATSPSGWTLTVYEADDTANIVDLLLVNDLEIKPAANGKPRKG
jgi:hypothetical protein